MSLPWPFFQFLQTRCDVGRIYDGMDNFSDTTAKTARMKMTATTPTWRSTRTSSVSSEEDYDKISHTKPTKQIAIFKVTFDSSKFVLIKQQ